MIRSSAQVNGNILNPRGAKHFLCRQSAVASGWATFVQRLSAVTIDEQGGKLKRRGVEAGLSFKYKRIKR
jgi:hypothetical protein